jgi:hypothetical protein
MSINLDLYEAILQSEIPLTGVFNGPCHTCYKRLVVLKDNETALVYTHEITSQPIASNSPCKLALFANRSSYYIISLP